jgi:hypothetical protein
MTAKPHELRKLQWSAQDVGEEAGEMDIDIERVFDWIRAGYSRNAAREARMEGELSVLPQPEYELMGRADVEIGERYAS